MLSTGENVPDSKAQQHVWLDRVKTGSELEPTRMVHRLGQFVGIGGVIMAFNFKGEARWSSAGIQRYNEEE
eukprot:3594213-Karenia_brevis.AAC.1